MPTKNKFWTVSQAIEEAKKRGIEVSPPTVHKWVDEFDLGHQPGGRGKRYVDPKKFINFITGKTFK